MRLEDFQKLLTLKMETLAKAREHCYNNLMPLVEEMSPNDPDLREVALSLINTENGLQDMMNVINAVVDKQLEAYNDVNNLPTELPKRRKEAEPEVETESERSNDLNSIPQSDHKPKHQLILKQMPASPVLHAATSNLLASAKKGNYRLIMPKTPPTARKLNFDESLF